MEGQSVFHTKLPASTEQEACSGAVQEYLALMQKFCGAGTHTAATFASILKDTAFGDIAGQFHQACEEIETAVKAEAVTVGSEVDAMLDRVAQPPHNDNDNNNIGHDIQVVAKGFGRILQLHCQFFLTSSETLAHFTKLRSVEEFLSAPTPPVSETASHNAPLDGHHGNSQSESASKSSDAKLQTVDSPSGIRKQISSFLSKKLSKSGSPGSEMPQSMFYVDVPKEGEAAEGQSSGESAEKVGFKCEPSGKDSCNVATGGAPTLQRAGIAHMESQLHKLSVSDNGDLREHSPGGSIARLKDSANISDRSKMIAEILQDGQVATQEELDSVIDFLSGCHKGAGMQAIPENLPPQSQAAMSRAVGSQLITPTIYNTPPPPINMSAEGMSRSMYAPTVEQAEPPDMYNQRGGQHRRSDGGLVTEQTPRDAKTNTWPYRPSPRSAGDMADFRAPYPTYHTFDGLSGADVEYSRYLASINKQMKQQSGGLASMVPPQGPWASTAPQPPLNKSWPVNLFNSDGFDGATRNWSTAGDSSSCSDESSNGDAPWMMGVDSLPHPRHKSRRHSSGGEDTFPSMAGPPMMPPGGEIRPRSVEDLLEPKSTNTWPPKQPWAKAPAAPPGPAPPVANQKPAMGSGDPLHPPLGMQWSDPLTNRPLSTWGAGWSTEKV